MYLILCTLQMFDHTTGNQVWHMKTLNPVTKCMKIWWEKWHNWRLSEQCAEDPSLQESHAVNKCGLWGFKGLYRLHPQCQVVQVHSLQTASYWRRHYGSWKHEWTIHSETEHNITVGLHLNEEKMQGSWSLARQRICGHINKMDVTWTDLAQDHVQWNTSIPSVLRTLQLKKKILFVVFYRYAT